MFENTSNGYTFKRHQHAITQSDCCIYGHNDLFDTVSVIVQPKSAHFRRFWCQIRKSGQILGNIAILLSQGNPFFCKGNQESGNPQTPGYNG